MFQIEPLLETFEGLFNTPALVEEVAKARRREKLPPGEEEAVGGGEFWTDGYFASTVGKHGDEAMTGKYVKNQGNEYSQLDEDRQLALF